MSRGCGWRWAGWVLVLFVALPLALWLSLPFVLPCVDFPVLTFDLPVGISRKLPKTVRSRTITAKPVFRRGRTWSALGLTIRGRALDWPYVLRADLAYLLLPWSGYAVFTLGLDGTRWQVNGSARGGIGAWKADARVSAPPLSEDEPLLASLVGRFAPPAVSNLVFSGSFGASVSAEKTREIPVTVWSAKGRLKDVCAACALDGRPVELRGFETSFGAEGIADRTTVRPFAPRAVSASFDGISVTNFAASVRMTETSLLVTEAGAGFCGGEVKLYSVFLNPERLTAGFTLFLDDIDTNEVVAHLKGFRGNATGRLHGKIPVFLRNGRELRLGNGYLYSIPGETGTIRFEDASPLLDNLVAGGVDEETVANFGKALANLSYSSLKFELRREADGDGLALGMGIEGSATHGGTTVPVSVSATLHGDLEQLINTGLKMRQGRE